MGNRAEDVKKQQRMGTKGIAAQTLQNRATSDGRGAPSCYARKREAQAFKITVTEDPHFNTIKATSAHESGHGDHRRGPAAAGWPVQPLATSENARRVKDLAGPSRSSSSAEDAEGQHSGHAGGRL